MLMHYLFSIKLANYYLSQLQQMPKFQLNQIVWSKHPKQDCLWPGVVLIHLTEIVHKSQKDDLQILFYSSNTQKTREIEIVHESACRDFNEYEINFIDSPLELYEAFKLAKKDYRLKNACRDDSEDATLGPPEWGATEMGELLIELLSGAKDGKRVSETKGGKFSFNPHEDEVGVYIRQSFCQKLNFLIHQSQLEGELLTNLKLSHSKLKTMLNKALKQGDI